MKKIKSKKQVALIDQIKELRGILQVEVEPEEAEVEPEEAKVEPEEAEVDRVKQNPVVNKHNKIMLRSGMQRIPLCVLR